MMKLLLHPEEKKTKSRDELLQTLHDAAAALLDAGKEITIFVAESEEMISPQRAGEILGFSRQHVRRLIDAGELEAQHLPNSSRWQVPVSSIAAFEDRREASTARADRFSRELDEMGAPPE